MRQCFLIYIACSFLPDCIPFLLKDGFKEIHFFGDKTFKGGNDFEIFQDERTVGTLKIYFANLSISKYLFISGHTLIQGHTVTSPEDTMRQVQEVLSKQK